MSLMVQDNPHYWGHMLIKKIYKCTSPFVCNAPHKTEQRTEVYTDAFLVLKIRYLSVSKPFANWTMSYVYHRRRKIWKVGGGAEYPIVREKFTTTPTCVKSRPFLHDWGCYHKFLGEKMNCESSGIDLAAIEAHLLIIRPGKCVL